MMQGSFLTRNSYALRDHSPWYVVFVAGGDLAGRADPFFDSSLEISPELLSEWRRFHQNRSTVPPVVAVHFPLAGEQLLRVMARLGLGSRTLAEGTATYLSTLASVAPYRECYLPISLLAAIEAEGVERPPFPELQRTVRGAWLSSEPQSRWSKRHTATDSTEGFLWYAPVYGAEESAWDSTLRIRGPEPEPQPPSAFGSLAEWLRVMRARGLRVVPLVAASEAWEEHEEAMGLALRAQEVQEPRGLVFQNLPDTRAWVPDGWWELSTGSESQLRLES